MNPRDVPSPIDLRDPVQARTWMEQTAIRRPWRPQFFATFVQALQAVSARPLRVLELGSGPGQLAAAILRDCNLSQYVALDSSPAMHALARENLGSRGREVKFLLRDFQKPEWNAALGRFDAIVTLQAIHETRHSDRLPRLFGQIRKTLKTGGVFLYCDHYRGRLKNPVLYLRREDQPRALAAAGFVHIDRLLDQGGMALHRAIA